MILSSDFDGLMSTTKNEVRELAKLYMTNYHTAGAVKREQFTENIFEMLVLVVTGSKYNPIGSFLDEGADQALDEEVVFNDRTYELMIILKGRMLQLERGEIDYSWLEKRWKGLSRRLVKDGHTKLASDIEAGIKAGEHKVKPPPRAYVSKAVHVHAPILAENIDELLLASFPSLRKV